MIVLEGPDGGGKTTLAGELVREFHLLYMRPPSAVLTSDGGPVNPRGLAEWWELELIDAKAGKRGQHVYDRSTYISDPIYRLVYHQRSGSTIEQMIQGVHYLINYALVIWCLPPWEDTLEALRQQNRENLKGLDEEKAEVVYWAYHYQYTLWLEACGNEDHCFLYNWRNGEELREVVKRWMG